MTLVEIEVDEAEALMRGEPGRWSTAPGWPHDDTSAGLGFARSRGRLFLILDDVGRLAGECGTKGPPRGGVVEIGYGLAAPSRGKGLGGRAVTELVNLLNAEPDITTVEAEIHISNIASRRIVERLGFATDGQPLQGYLRYRLAVV